MSLRRALSRIQVRLLAFNALLVSAKSGVKTVADIKKKKAKISTYLPGHELNLLAMTYILKPNGVEASDFKQVQ